MNCPHCKTKLERSCIVQEYPTWYMCFCDKCNKTFMADKTPAQDKK